MAKFKRAVLGDLMFDKYQNNIMLRTIRKYEGKAIDENVRLCTVGDGTGNRLIGFQTLPWQMIWFFCGNKYDEEVLNFYIDNVIASGWNLNQIQGDEKSARRFAEIYSGKAGKEYHKKENLIVYRLGELCKSDFVCGKFRQCNMYDMGILPYWGVAFYEECELEEVGKTLEYQVKNMTEQIGGYHVWEVEGRPVSMAAMREISDGFGSIGAVYTPPVLRGKGYAFANVWNLCNKYRDKYPDIMLYADADYPQSNKIYQKIGFKPLFNVSQYTFKNRE